MKKYLIIGILLYWATWLGAQTTPEQFTVSIEKVQQFSNAPALHSFVIGQANDKWLLIGGRKDGLHRRQPWAAFQATDNNVTVYVVDVQTKQVWSAALSSLGTSYQEQLQSTNMNFKQVDSLLYIVGGYGYSATSVDHITYPYITVVNVPQVIDAVVNGTSFTSHFRQVQHSFMEVTGGQLGYLDGTFYLAGGQKFIGRYNPMGPTHGPGFIQEYTNAIRKFKIVDNAGTLSVQQATEWYDSLNLHRRDYNMVPQIFPNGETGFTIFSGVFQYGQDLPWLNTVNVDTGGYAVVPQFDQMLTQYHSAKMGIHDASANIMHSIFFGGMSRYHFDSTGTMWDDPNVPFVKTISQVTRFSNDSLMEYELTAKMPGFLGSGAEFFPLHTVAYDDQEILDLNNLPTGKTLVGHIYGGIESSQENIFFINTGVESWASNAIFEVYIEKTVNTALVEPDAVESKDVLLMTVFPNPVKDQAKISFSVPYYSNYQLTVINSAGKLVKKVAKGEGKGQFITTIDTKRMADGIYFVVLENDGFRRVEKISVQK
ncbi:MAG: T9SS type A sorting domain-containing protein [Aureispira sp.]|nr:T9SS type A sorting domain-containing protein [Aureispira sp.]